MTFYCKFNGNVNFPILAQIMLVGKGWLSWYRVINMIYYKIGICL